MRFCEQPHFVPYEYDGVSQSLFVQRVHRQSSADPTQKSSPSLRTHVAGMLKVQVTAFGATPPVERLTIRHLRSADLAVHRPSSLECLPRGPRVLPHGLLKAIHLTPQPPRHRWATRCETFRDCPWCRLANVCS